MLAIPMMNSSEVVIVIIYHLEPDTSACREFGCENQNMYSYVDWLIIHEVIPNSTTIYEDLE